MPPNRASPRGEGPGGLDSLDPLRFLLPRRGRGQSGTERPLQSAGVIFVGPAGWSYPDWEGVVYPRRKPRGFHPLRYLAPFVDCVEVNSTFYALPQAKNAERWVAEVRELPAFRFLAKIHRCFTHDTWTDDRIDDARAYVEGTQPLRESGKLFALLAQFPVSFRRTPEGFDRLRRIRDLFPADRLVVELRHRTWFEPDAVESLRPLDVSLAHIDLPASKVHPPEDHDVLGPIGYLRLHGRNGAAWFAKDSGRDARYDYLYDRAELAGIVARARLLAGRRDEVYLVTNNHYGGKGMANAIEIRSMLAGEPVAAPEPLLDAFPSLRPLTVPTGQLPLF
jgi:uncharacterized protein YecE (DUF72 family)